MKAASQIHHFGNQQADSIKHSRHRSSPRHLHTIRPRRSKTLKPVYHEREDKKRCQIRSHDIASIDIPQKYVISSSETRERRGRIGGSGGGSKCTTPKAEEKLQHLPASQPTKEKINQPHPSFGPCQRRNHQVSDDVDKIQYYGPFGNSISVTTTTAIPTSTSILQRET